MNTIQKIIATGMIGISTLIGTGCEYQKPYKPYQGELEADYVILTGVVAQDSNAAKHEDNLFVLKTLDEQYFNIRSKNVKGMWVDQHSNTLELGKTLAKQDTIKVCGDIKDATIEADYIITKNELIIVYNLIKE